MIKINPVDTRGAVCPYCGHIEAFPLNYAFNFIRRTMNYSCSKCNEQFSVQTEIVFTSEKIYE
jgi:DNA-directed RNA polymerase subunit RPC12/RpoP